MSNKQDEIDRVSHKINLFIAHVAQRKCFDLQEQDNLAAYLVAEGIGTDKRFEVGFVKPKSEFVKENFGMYVDIKPVEYKKEKKDD